jgi:hypothetical protein
VVFNYGMLSTRIPVVWWFFCTRRVRFLRLDFGKPKFVVGIPVSLTSDRLLHPAPPRPREIFLSFRILALY